MVIINSCVLNFEFEPFRAYEKGIASAVQNVYTTSSTNTTVNTSSYESASVQSTSTDQSKLTTTSTQSASYATTSSGGNSTATSSSTILQPQYIQDNGNGYSNAVHNHGMQEGVWIMLNNGNWKVDSSGKVTGGSTVQLKPSGAHTHGEHSHRVEIPSHTHQVTIPAHSHSLTIPSHNHTVQIPGHSHTLSIPGHSHSVTIPAHTHEMSYGIYKTGGVSVGKLYVNGKLIGNVNPNTNIKLESYLADTKGKIARNTFHKIEIYPVAQTGNTQGLTRIVASVFLQIFTNSRGSGDY